MAPTKVHETTTGSKELGTYSGLSPEQTNRFRRDGYLILPSFLTQHEVQSLKHETKSLLANIPLEDHPMTKFSTGGESGEKHVGDEYFLTSGDKVRFFFEEDAFGPDGTLQKPPARAINKIGHSLHTLSPPFRSITMSSSVAAIARSLNFRNPEVLQSMIICKQPEIGGAVPPHQDSTFLYTNPPSAVGFWIALEDATHENGCLSFLPGSHLREPVRKRFVRMSRGGTGFEEVSGAKFPQDDLAYAEEPEWEVVEKSAEYKPEEVEAGTLVLIHGNLLHKSEKNLSPKSRFIYTFHVIEGDQEYDDKNWLQPNAAGFSPLYRTKNTTVNTLSGDW